jgi:hypothetical protein
MLGKARFFTFNLMLMNLQGPHTKSWLGLAWNVMAIWKMPKDYLIGSCTCELLLFDCLLDSHIFLVQDDHGFRRFQWCCAREGISAIF